MRFILNKGKVTLEGYFDTNVSGTIKYYEIPIEYDETWENLVIKAIIVNKDEDTGEEISVINNKFFIDKKKSGIYRVGFVGYTIENEQKIYQVSTDLVSFIIDKGAGEIEGVESHDIPTPSEWEVYIAQIQSMVDDFEDKIPTKLSQLQNDNHTVQDENYIHTDNNFSNEDKDKLDSLENYDDTQIKDDIQEINSDIEEINTNLLNYSLITETGSKIDLEINSSTYELVAKLYDKNNILISTSRKIDLPIESMVVSGSYDSVNKKIVLTLDNGNTIDIPIGDLISGLQAEITSENKLESDLVDDTNQTNKFVTTQEKETWNAKYDKPNTGIPKTDLSSEVQASLDKADTAIQDVSGKEDKSNKVIELTSESTDTQYPSAKCVYDSQEAQNEQITAIENQIPTGEENDTSITLTDSADYKVKEFGIEGNTEQATSVQSANFFDEEKYKNVSYSTGVYNYAKTDIKGDRTLYFKAKLKEGKTSISGLYLVLTNNGSNPNNGIKAISVSNGIIVGSSSIYSQDFSGVTDLYLAYYPTSISVADIFNTYDLWVSTTDTTYTPFIPDSPSPEYTSPVNNVTGDVEVKVQNGNLAWNGWAEDFVSRINDNTRAILKTQDNRSCLSYLASAGSGDYDNKYMFKTNWKENTQYTVSYYAKSTSGYLNLVIEYTDGTISTILGQVISDWSKVTLISTANKTIKYIRVQWSAGTTYIDLDTFMVVEGTTAGEYIPHQEQNYPISLGNIELCKIGDYPDKIFKTINGNTVYDSLTSEQKAGLTYGNWYKYEVFGKVDLATLRWNLVEASGNGGKYSTSSLSTLFKYLGQLIAPNILAEKYVSVPENKRITNGEITNVGTRWIYCVDETGTPSGIMYYELATPTITPITDTTLINQLNALEEAYTYKGVTHIDTDVETKPYMKVVYRKDIGLILERIENLEARVSLLE